MSRLTFEASLRSALANSRLARIVAGESPSLWWKEALREDEKDVENIINKLCEDLTLLMGRSVVRFSKLKTESELPVAPLYSEDMARIAFSRIQKCINNFIKQTIGAIRCCPIHNLTAITYPIHPISWDKHGVKLKFPNHRGKVSDIKLYNPEQKRCDEVDQPSHIRRLLNICEWTHFDYQPFVLDNEKGCKILAIKLGCDWNDLAIATWESPPLLTFNVLLVLVAIVCAFSMVGGLWLSSCCEAWWLSIPLMLFSGVVGFIGGLLTTLVISLVYKPLKL